MDQYITVTSSDQNPCNFVSNFTNSININDGYEVAVKSIFHAPLFNITEHDNKFTLTRELPNRNPELCDFFIPIGFYESTCSILGAIYNVLMDAIKEEGYEERVLIKKAPTFRYISSDVMQLQLDTNERISFMIDNNRDEDVLLLKHLGYCINGRVKRLDIRNYDLESTCEAGFLYSNIVTNSLIDQTQSRLLACIPINSKVGYNYHEIENPVYKPLSVHSFTDISFVCTDVRGNTLQMDHFHVSQYGYARIIYPTIILLHIRKI